MPLNNNHSFKSLLLSVTDDTPTVGTFYYWLIESAKERVLVKAQFEYDAICYFRKATKGTEIHSIKQLKFIHP